MEFDVNLILVPITLIFLVAYLADKLWLKQYKLVKQNTKQLSFAQTHFEECQKAFAKSLKTHGGGMSVEHFQPSATTPTEVLTLHDNYHTAKRKVAELQSKLGDTKAFFLVGWAYEYLPILAFLVVVRAFVIEPFNIPSSSMVPTLYTGDFIIVNKSAYGLRLPVLHTKILDTGSPQHGDVVVFRYPLNEKRYYIKRVIGVAGDRVSYNSGVLSINGKPVQTTKTDYQMPDTLNAKLMPAMIDNQRLTDDERADFGKKEEKFAHYYRENLGEHSYLVRYLGNLNSAKDGEFLKKQSPSVIDSVGETWEITIPEGQYFVMGDNRDRSEDGRFWGFVSERHLAGKATYIWMHKEAGLKVPTFARAGKID